MQDDSIQCPPVSTATGMLIVWKCVAAIHRSDLKQRAFTYCETKQDHEAPFSIGIKDYDTVKKKWVMPRNDSKQIGVDWVAGTLITEWMRE